MEALKLSLVLLKRDKKNLLFYLLSSTISFGVLFGIFNIIFDPNIKNNITQEHYVSLSLVNLLVIFLILIIGYYSNNFFMEKRKKEIAVELISGLNLNNLAFSTAVINFLISLFSLIGGFIIGIIISPIINKILYSFIGLTNVSFSITLDGIISSFFIVFINITLLGLLNVGLGYRTEICDLVRSKSGLYKAKKIQKYGK